jgi:hypothetical protein
MTRSLPVTCIPSEAPEGSRVFGYDRPQYAFYTSGMPVEVLEAVHQGLCSQLYDFDPRQIDWDI